MRLWHRQAWSAVAASAVLGVGCGGSEAPPRDAVGTGEPRTETQPQTPPAELALAPQRLVDACGELSDSRTVAVLCPQRLPPARWVIAHKTLLSGRCQYLVDWTTDPLGSGKAFHLLAGGRCQPFSLATIDDQWPPNARMPRDLGLVGTAPLEPGEEHGSEERVRLRLLRRARVAGHEALLLSVKPYPSGGVHGGHLAVVWNERGAGYTLTLHFPPQGRSRKRQEAAVLGAATSMSGSRRGD